MGTLEFFIMIWKTETHTNTQHRVLTWELAPGQIISFQVSVSTSSPWWDVSSEHVHLCLHYVKVMCGSWEAAIPLSQFPLYFVISFTLPLSLKCLFVLLRLFLVTLSPSSFPPALIHSSYSHSQPFFTAVSIKSSLSHDLAAMKRGTRGSWPS